MKRGENMVSNQKLNITFDTNCIIDIEKRGSPYSDLQRLVQHHKDQKIHLRVVAISASERMPNGQYASNNDDQNSSFGTWHGPYRTFKEAKVKALKMGWKIKYCRVTGLFKSWATT
jgi:hypothetical protein